MDMGARDLAAELEQLGLTLRDTVGDARTWRDICVVDYYEGPTLPCAWLAHDPDTHIAWLAGTAPGPVAGPTHQHEATPVRVSPQQVQKLLAEQHPPPPPAAPTHESTLLPLTERLADELMLAVPPTARLDALIFHAHFPRRGEFVSAGVILHDQGGETRRIPDLELTATARELLAAIASHDSDQRLTAIEIKIAGDGRTITNFGIAPPLSAEALAAHLDRLYASIPEAPAPTPAGGLLGFVRGIFSTAPAVLPPPALAHVPRRRHRRLRRPARSPPARARRPRWPRPDRRRLGHRHAHQVAEAVPVGLDELRAYLVADSPYGSKVYPCWLLGAPDHVELSLDLSVALVAGAPAYGWSVTAKLL